MQGELHPSTSRLGYLVRNNKHLLLQNGYVLYEARDSAKIYLTKKISF